MSTSLERTINALLKNVKCREDGDSDNGSRWYEAAIGEHVYQLTKKTVRYFGHKYETTVTADIRKGTDLVHLFFDDNDIRVSINGKEVLRTLGKATIDQDVGEVVALKLNDFLEEVQAYKPPAEHIKPPPMPSGYEPAAKEDLDALHGF